MVLPQHWSLTSFFLAAASHLEPQPWKMLIFAPPLRVMTYNTFNVYSKYNKGRLSLLFSERDSNALQAFLIDFIVLSGLPPYLHISLSTFC